MTLAQVYNAIKGSIAVNWYVGQLGSESFVEMANTCLMYIRTYLWRKRSWQLTVQKMTWRDVGDDKVAYFRTEFPIVNTNIRFYYSDEVEKIEIAPDGRKFPCTCEEHLDLSACNTCRDCCDDDKQVEMEYLQPWSPLKDNTYTITWGSYGWGVLGNRVKAKFSPQCNVENKTMYLVYYAWPRLIKCLNDDIPLPDYYIEAFKLMLKWLMSTNIFNGQSNKETLWFTFAKEIVEGLDYNENNIPSKFSQTR